MRYALGPQKVSHPEILAQADIMVAHGEHQPHGCIPFQKPWITGVRDVIDRIVEIKITVVITVHKWLHVEGAAHRNAGGSHIWMLQGKVQRVVASQAAPCRTNLLPPADAFHQGKNL